MEPSVLVASHLSALFPLAQPIPVYSTQKDIIYLSPRSDSGHPLEHASLSTLFHSPLTGTILLRVTHGGFMLELVSLSSEVPPLRFDFPASILPSPSIVLSQSEELHVLLATRFGSLYRIVIPIREGAPLWQATANRRWYREYVIQTAVDEGLVQVQSTHCVVISLPGGSLLRLEAESLGGDTTDDVWRETRADARSFLHSITSLLHAGPPGSSDIVSISSHPQPTDIGSIWTVSRDRHLRMWTARCGCVAEHVLPSTAPGRSTVASRSSPTPIKPSVLLPPEPQKLLCVFTPSHADDPHVLVFVPTEGSLTSGGFFQLFIVNGDALRSVTVFDASATSVHCHLQDFTVMDDTLYTLWDKQGQSMVEVLVLSWDDSDPTATGGWSSASYAQEAELTPAYLDELLLSPGSAVDKFVEAIMRPGMFSPLTLHTAIARYTDACRSLPPPYPPQLLLSYASVAEQITSVVGCTVQRTKDPRTGAPLDANYWNAFKRDWEGFIARCREIERNGRWPLAIGRGNPEDGALIVERERIASLVGEDLPLRLRRELSSSQPMEKQFDILKILSTMRTRLGPRLMRSLEGRLQEVVRQEIAFPYADIIQDQVRVSNFHEEVDEGLESWIVGRVRSLEHDSGKSIQELARHVLDVIGGLGKEVKREEDDGELLSRPISPEWLKALTASYATTSIHARYEFSLALVVFLFFLADELPQWDPGLLAEIFVVFRGVAMLRYVARQPAGDNATPTTQASGPGPDDEVVAKLRNMHVSASRGARFQPTYSLVHWLANVYGISFSSGLPVSAHRFLDRTGLLQSLSPAYATHLEVVFCERLRQLGYYEVAREVLAWLPRTPAVTYVLGRLWLDEGRYDDAGSAFEVLAGSFGPHSALSIEDREALADVLPSGRIFDTQLEFYLHASDLFKAAISTYHDVFFTQLALSEPGVVEDTTPLWTNVIKGLTDLGQYEDAYAALISAPHERLKRDSISQLLYRMCEENAVDRLMALNFAGLADEVEDALAFKARNADPRIRPFYSRILYTWYVSRGDYRNAALTMYQRARKLEALMGDASAFTELVELQLEAYIVAMNALALVDPKSQWITLPIVTETGNEPRKRRRLSKYIPESKYASGKRDTEAVDLKDMQHEYALLSARAELVRRDPTLLSAGEYALPPASIVVRLAQANRFNTAMATARSLDLDMTDIFSYLVGRCLRLSRNPESVLSEDMSDWLLTDKVSSWPGTPAERGWRYLRQSLERHDGPQTDYRYSKVALETIVSFDRTSPPPPWLIHKLEEHHPEYLIRTCLRYEVLEAALDYTLSMMRRSDSRLTEDMSKTAAATWLPYTLIDQVLVAADTQADLSSRGRASLGELRAEIATRMKRVQKYSQASA
ncbi:nucleoporin Nup120/160-domain-containing protein [Dichomitus squalens]|uniref:Nucleoporin Nup120/160-domain-containing protein n=1 Tax=Dichomitus squalens TaxID=114155 RepID=A0A4Q9P7K2_9APHY|nr:nucleoporin Nup120/160-domain-containing protein [Dichomitus squalens]TBU61320.1 nucleoporin Nup120/160-domain-containing protein [Dichomitus squalens]